MNRLHRIASAWPNVSRAIAAAVLVTVAIASAAQEYRQFPGAQTDMRTLRIQDRVENIFSSGDYSRAMLIYEKELAPLGDKYAQYMVGFMHLTGKGVEQNGAEALAWYRLAAERGEAPFVKARDALRDSLEPAELERSEILFAELWQRYGDRKLLLDLIDADLEVLGRAAAAGDAMHSGGAGVGASLATGYSQHGASDGYIRRVRARLIERLQFLSSTTDAAEAGIEDATAMEKLESEVRRELKALDLP